MTVRSVPGARLVLRGALTTPGVSLFVVLVAALVALGGAAAPALLRDARTGTVHAALDDLAPVARDLTGTVRGVTRPGTGPADGVDAAVADLWGAPIARLRGIRDSLDPSVRDALDEPRVIVALDPESADTLDLSPRPANRLLVTFDPRYAEHVRFVAGEAPDAAETDVLPLALSRASADALDWSVGEVRQLRYPYGVALTVVLRGVFEPVDPDGAQFAHVPTAARPDVVDDGQGNLTYYVSGYAPPERLRDALPAGDSAVTTVWYGLRVDRVPGDAAADIAARLRGAVSTEYPFPVIVQNQLARGLLLHTTAPTAIDGGVARASAMTAVVSLVAVGPLAVAVVAAALTGRMLATRRVTSVRLARTRGASSRRLAALLAGEGLVLGAVGAIAGCLTAAALVGWGGPASALVPVLAAVTPAVVIPVATMTAAQRSARADLGRSLPGRGRRRLIVEIGVVLASAAVVSAAVARGRGAGGIDPLLILLPVALSAAGCVLALRLVPLLLSLAERGVPGRAGLVSLVGPARARRDPAVRAAPVLAVVVGIAITLFSVAFSETVRAGIDTSAKAQVGADARVDAPYIAAEQLDRIAAVAGVRAISPVYFDERVEGRSRGQRVPLTVYVVDAAALADVQTDVASALPPVPTATVGSTVPVVGSAQLVAELGGADLEIADATVDVVAEASPASPLAGSWVLVDRTLADRLVSVRFAPDTVLIAVDAGADPDAVADLARAAVGERATATTPGRVAERLDRDPALQAVRVALVASIAIVAVLLGLAVAMTLILGAGTRGRMLALLAALGYPRRRELPLVVWDVAPALLAALPLGIAAGVAMPFLVVPALDLTRFVGGDVQPAIALGGWLPAAVVAGFLLLGAVAVASATVAASRITAAATLRGLDEEG